MMLKANSSKNGRRELKLSLLFFHCFLGVLGFSGELSSLLLTTLPFPRRKQQPFSTTFINAFLNPPTMHKLNESSEDDTIESQRVCRYLEEKKIHAAREHDQNWQRRRDTLYRVRRNTCPCSLEFFGIGSVFNESHTSALFGHD